MHLTKVLASTLFLLTSTLATPIEPRACAATCGSVCYNSADISNAVGDGYAKYKAGTTSNSYPHTYNNYEGFDFPVNGPYQEYPILSSYKDYSGGSPGADRVIFNTGGSLAGVITHTGASGNNFVGCSGSEGAHT